MTTARDLVDALRGPLRTASFPPDDPNGLWRGDPGRGVTRIGVALDPPAALAEQIRARRLDALWLHRPWSLEAAEVPAGFPVLAHHLSFDEALTPGYSPLLAARFGLDALEPLGTKAGRPLGMIGAVEAAPLAAWVDRLRRAFGGYEALAGDPSGPARVTRVAFAGAFWPAMVEEADARGVDLYVTGQLRRPGQDALRGRCTTALALGHARCERWGLDRLVELLEAAGPALEVVRLDAA